MYSIKNKLDHRNDDDIENVINLLNENVDCTNKLIQHIDSLIEKKHLSETILRILKKIRNTCAVNMMNLARLTK